MDRKEEAKFFAYNEPYTHVEIKYLWGIDNLVAKLKNVLAQEISHNLHNMRAERDRALQRANEELNALGPPYKFERDYRTEFDNIVHDIMRYFREAGNGEYCGINDAAKGVSVQGLKRMLERCELGGKVYKRCNRFKDDIRRVRFNTQSEEYQQNLEKIVKSTKDGRMDVIMMDKHSVMYQVRLNAEKWKGLAEQMYSDIANITISCLHIIVRVCSSKYKEIPKILLSHLTSMISEQKEKALLRLKWHYLDEILRPNTLMDIFVEAYRKEKPSGLGESDKKNRNTFINALEASLPAAEARFTDNAVRTIVTHVLDVPINHRELRFDAPPQFKFSPEAIRKDTKLEYLLVLSEDLGEKRDQISEKVAKLESLRAALNELAEPAGIDEDDDASVDIEEDGSVSGDAIKDVDANGSFDLPGLPKVSNNSSQRASVENESTPDASQSKAKRKKKTSWKRKK